FSVTLPAPSEIYPLSLHDALPIWLSGRSSFRGRGARGGGSSGRRGRRGSFLVFVLSVLSHSAVLFEGAGVLNAHALDRTMELFLDRKSTRLNSSHVKISYAVFCLK